MQITTLAPVRGIDKLNLSSFHSDGFPLTYSSHKSYKRRETAHNWQEHASLDQGNFVTYSNRY